MRGALAGVKVADFTWALAGPWTTTYLASHGATVVRVESGKRPCVLRTMAPYKDKRPGLDRSACFAYYNSNKYSISLNMSHPKGLELAKKLVAWADIVGENFTPGTMERWGLGYEDLKKINPDIIMFRSSNQGQTGPHAMQPGFGMQLLGLAGFPQFTGWADRDPDTLAIAYTDVISPRFTVAALMAALDYRDRTGKGQVLDVAQLEAGLHFLAPAIMEYTVNGRETPRAGNRCPCAAPHGTYPCKGDDRWCAIAVFTDEEWQAFSRVVARPWTQEPGFATLLGRKQNEDELDRLVGEWTVQFTAEEVMRLMQDAGVAAGVVESTADLLQDAQLKARNHFWVLHHRELGAFSHLGQAFKLSETPADPRMPAPCLGEHTEYVCTKILGMPDEEFIGLMADGVFE